MMGKYLKVVIRAGCCSVILIGSVRASFLGDVLFDFADIPVNMWAKETLCVSAAFIPAFFWGRECDESIHSRYFCRAHRKNVCAYPDWWHEFSDKSAMAVDLSIGAILMLWPDEEKRRMGHVFFVGSIYTVVVKDLLKKIRWDNNLRPENSCFDCSRRYYGGYPSGHMALSLYMATYFAKVAGPKWAIPFGIWAGAIFVDSLRCNRHYFSQLLAGGCLGVAFGFAAAKTFFDYQKDGFSCGFDISPDGRPVVRASYEF